MKIAHFAAASFCAAFAVACFAARDRGLVIVRAVNAAGEPLQCRIFDAGNGNVLGTTPAFLSTLETNRTYKISLSANGYRDDVFDLAVADRTPVVCTRKMMLDSGTVVFGSSPAGARITVNGRPEGFTPARVPGVAKGSATVVFEKDGYKPARRTFKIDAGEEIEIFEDLAPLPALLHVVSMPSGARVYLNGEFKGETPADVEVELAGDYDVRVEKDDFATAERAVSLSRGAEKTEEFRLVSTAGTLNVITTPPGAEIYVDGKKAGATRGQPGENESAALPVPGISNTRAHEIKAVLRGYRTETFKLEPGMLDPASPKVKRFVLHKLANFVVLDKDGREHRGVLKRRDHSGIYIETRPGNEVFIPEGKIISAYEDLDTSATSP